MKAFFYPYIVTALLAVSSVGVAEAELISPVSTAQSKCKGFDYTRSYDEVGLSSSITYNDGSLSLTVYNIFEHCGASITVDCNADIPGEIHFILYDTSEVLTDCMCTFDVECRYDNIIPGHYDIYVENRWGGVLLQTSADIEPGCDIRFSRTTGLNNIIGEPSEMLRFSSQGILTVLAEGATTLEAYDSEGRDILKMTVEGKSEIDFSTLPKGIYLLRATNGNRSESIKFMR